MTMDHKQELEKLYTTGGIGQILRRFAIPSVLAFLIAALYNMVDQIYIGHGIGYLGNSATNVVYPLTVFAVAIALLIGNGCAAYLSLTQGRGEFEKGSRAVGNSVVLLVVSSILLVPLYYFFKMDLLKMFGLTSDNSRYARFRLDGT